MGTGYAGWGGFGGGWEVGELPDSGGRGAEQALRGHPVPCLPPPVRPSAPRSQDSSKARSSPRPEVLRGAPLSLPPPRRPAFGSRGRAGTRGPLCGLWPEHGGDSGRAGAGNLRSRRGKGALSIACLKIFRCEDFDPRGRPGPSAHLSVGQP